MQVAQKQGGARLAYVENVTSRFQERSEVLKRVSVHVRRTDRGAVTNVLCRILVRQCWTKMRTIDCSESLNDPRRAQQLCRKEIIDQLTVGSSTTTPSHLGTSEYVVVRLDDN